MPSVEEAVVRVSVAGASGYAGGELLRLVHGHPALDLAVVAAGAASGQAVSDLHPQLPQLAGLVFAPTRPELLAEADLVLLALPHGESAAIAAQLPADLPVVDLGADFRLVDSADWEAFYGTPHAGTWTYGLPELPGARARIASSRRVANPGCYVTAITLALAPLLAAGLALGDDLVVVGASGTSGAGRAPKASLLASEVMGSMSAYKVGGSHQHTPEVVQNLRAATGRDVRLSFTPLLAPMPRGILATCSAPVAAGVGSAQVRDCLAAAYDHEPFVHLLPDGQWPVTAATAGGNSVHLQAAVDHAAGRVTVVAALDNLVKGAAGQAVQNANLVLGLPETTGLSGAGVAP
jgi:N-acetyl-gamma-glutamyl-phosphate reductase